MSAALLAVLPRAVRRAGWWWSMPPPAAGRAKPSGADPRHRERCRPSGERAPGDARGMRWRPRPPPRRLTPVPWRRAGGVGGDGTSIPWPARPWPPVSSSARFRRAPSTTWRCHTSPPTRREAVAAVLGGRCGRCRWAAPTDGIFPVNASFGSLRACSKTGRSSSGSGAQPAGRAGAALLTSPATIVSTSSACRRAPRGAGAGARAHQFDGLRRQQPPATRAGGGCRRRHRWRPAGWWGWCSAPRPGRAVRAGLQGAPGRLGEAHAVERPVFRRLQIEPGGAGGGPATWRWPSTARPSGRARRWCSTWPGNLWLLAPAGRHEPPPAALRSPLRHRAPPRGGGPARLCRGGGAGPSWSPATSPSAPGPPSSRRRPTSWRGWPACPRLVVPGKP